MQSISYKICKTLHLKHVLIHLCFLEKVPATSESILSLTCVAQHATFLILWIIFSWSIFWNIAQQLIISSSVFITLFIECFFLQSLKKISRMLFMDKNVPAKWALTFMWEKHPTKAKSRVYEVEIPVRLCIRG